VAVSRRAADATAEGDVLRLRDQLDTLLARLAAESLIKAGGKQRTDSTRIIAAVAARNRPDAAAESLRAADGLPPGHTRIASP
jgi:hypothetical protein